MPTMRSGSVGGDQVAPEKRGAWFMVHFAMDERGDFHVWWNYEKEKILSLRSLMRGAPGFQHRADQWRGVKRCYSP